MALLKAGLAATLGAGAVLLLCRFVLLPFTADFKWVQYAGIVLVVLGAAGLRSVQDEVSKLWLAAGGVLGAAVAFAAFHALIKPTPAADVSLVKREFPGVIAHLPADEPALDQTAMANGRLKLDRIGGARGLAELGWQPGHTEVTPEQMGDLMKAVAPGKLGAVESEATVVSTHSGTALMMPLNDTAIYLSSWYCEPHDRDFTLTTMIMESRERGRQFHKKIADGIQCHVGDKPVIEVSKPLVSLPPGYGYLPGADPPSFMNLDGEELAIQPIPSEMARQVVKQPSLILKMFEVIPEVENPRLAGQSTVLARDSSERVVFRVRYVEEGSETFASVTTIDCGEAPSFLALHAYSAESQSAAEEVLLSAVCHDGGKPQTHPTLHEVSSKACDAKDGRGCYMMSILVDAADSSKRGEIKGHLERGCELEHGHSCNDLAVLLEDEGATDNAKVLLNKACELGVEASCED